MKKINIVKSNREFNEVINKGIKHKNTIFYLYILKNDYKYNRYGIAVSKKIGNAVIRNKYKRQIKDIINDILVPNIMSDFVFIVRPNIKNLKYSEFKEETIKLINKLGENYEKQNV